MTAQDHLPSPEYPLPAEGADQPPRTANEPWESMYQAERKRTRILGATTVAASLLAVGLGAWGLNNQGSAVASGPGQFGRPGGASQMAPGQGTTGTLPGPGPMGQDLGTLLLNSDGSVNTAAVEQFVAQAPSGALEQILAFAVQNGELTQDQADEIAKIASTSNAQDT